MNIKDINVDALKALIHKEGDEFDSMVGTDLRPGNALSDAITEVLAAEKKSKIARAASEVLKAFQASDEKVNTLVAEVRCMRAKERAALEQLKKIDHARAYARESMNLMPLISALKGDNENTVPASFGNKNKVKK